MGYASAARLAEGHKAMTEPDLPRMRAGRPIVFLTHSPDMFANFYGDRALAALREHADVRVNTTGTVLADPAALVRAAGDAHILVADRSTPIAAAVFDAMPNLLAACRVAVDISTIDVPAASRAGVLVTRATPGFVTAVCELALGLLVDLARGVSTSVAAYRRGAAPPLVRGRQLAGATLGIVGYGAIGRRLAELGAALGMKVIICDPYQTIAPGGPRQTGFETLLNDADYVVCLALSTPDTAGLFGAAAFRAMRSDAYFINLSRGELVDEQALAAALDDGQLAGAAMDVGRAQDQRPSPSLAARADVIATPHIGGLTLEAAEHQAFDTVQQVAALAAGRVPDGAVNAEAATKWQKNLSCPDSP